MIFSKMKTIIFLVHFELKNVSSKVHYNLIQLSIQLIVDQAMLKHERFVCFFFFLNLITKNMFSFVYFPLSK